MQRRGEVLDEARAAAEVRAAAAEVRANSLLLVQNKKVQNTDAKQRRLSSCARQVLRSARTLYISLLVCEYGTAISCPRPPDIATNIIVYRQLLRSARTRSRRRSYISILFNI